MADDPTRARFLHLCAARDRTRDKLTKLHTQMAQLTNREAAAMIDLARINASIDQILEDADQ